MDSGRRKGIWTSWCCALLLICCHSIAEATVYSIAPVSLSDGYKIEEGYFTTDGTLGPLDVSNVLDFEVRVSGPLPFTIQRFGMPSGGITINGLIVATPTSIVIPVDDDPSVSGKNSLFLTDLDTMIPQCGACFVDTTWTNDSSQSPESSISYNLVDVADAVPDPDVHAQATFGRTALIVATIPEPSAALMLALGVATGCSAIRRRAASR